MKATNLVVMLALLAPITVPLDATEESVTPRGELSKRLIAYMQRFERNDDEQLIARLAVFCEEQVALKESGWKPPWDGYKKVRSRSEYEKLNTAEVAKECFATSLWARECLIYEDPAYGIARSGVFHEGLDTLYQRADLWGGIAAVLGDLCKRLEAAKTDQETMDVLFTFKELKAAYTYPAFHDRLKGHEAVLLQANMAALKAILSYSNRAERSPGRAFWGAVAADGICFPAVALFKRVDPAHYADLIEKLDKTEISFAEPEPQQVKRLLQLVVTSVEASIASVERAPECDQGKRVNNKVKLVAFAEYPSAGSVWWAPDGTVLEEPPAD